MNASIIENFQDWLLNNSFIHHTKITAFIFLLIIGIVIGLVMYFIGKKIIIYFLHHIAKRTKTNWDDILLHKHFFHRLAWLAPFVFLHYYVSYTFHSEYPVFVNFIQHLLLIAIIMMILWVINSFLNAMQVFLTETKMAKRKPVNVYIQFIRILAYTVGISFISVIIFPDFIDILKGLGIMSAVVMLIFKDTILGFVGGLQIGMNDMVRPGDWITLSKHNVDGVVQEINLLSLKVQNFDKTIITLPTYTLMSESFQNWYGMEDAGGRRIKRSLYIDMTSVKFCSQELLEQWKKIQILTDYIQNKQTEIQKYNREKDVNEDVLLNGRRQTNLGVFRAYVATYLRNRSDINQELTFLVRQLDPQEKGIPIEIYVFTNTVVWSEYESIQADIFDHIISAVPEFELRIFQNPTGKDFSKITQ